MLDCGDLYFRARLTNKLEAISKRLTKLEGRINDIGFSISNGLLTKLDIRRTEAWYERDGVRYECEGSLNCADGPSDNHVLELLADDAKKLKEQEIEIRTFKKVSVDKIKQYIDDLPVDDNQKSKTLVAADLGKSMPMVSNPPSDHRRYLVGNLVPTPYNTQRKFSL